MTRSSKIYQNYCFHNHLRWIEINFAQTCIALKIKLTARYNLTHELRDDILSIWYWTLGVGVIVPFIRIRIIFIVSGQFHKIRYNTRRSARRKTTFSTIKPSLEMREVSKIEPSQNGTCGTLGFILLRHAGS